MIEKIEIKDTATYIDETLDNLSKVNFIYGNNGSGKTTISRIITNESAYPNCKIYWKSNHTLETVVYNTDFINDNFEQSEEIKGIFTLGKEEADTQKKIKDEKNNIEDITNKINELTDSLFVNEENIKNQNTISKEKFWKIKQAFDKEKTPLVNAIAGARGKIDTFFDRVLSEYKNNKSELKTKEELEEIARQCYVDSSEQLLPVTIIPYSEIENLESNEILNKSIVGKDDLDIADLIKSLKNSDWVKTGMKYVSLSNSKCPFCQQTLPANLEERLNDYFDVTYENDKNTVIKLKRDYSNAISIYLDNVNKLLSSSYEQLNKDELKITFTSLQKITDSNFNEINKKLENLSQKFALKSILDYCKKIDAIILDANNKINEHNKFIQNIKTEKQKLEPLVWKYICNELKDDIKEYSDNIGKLETEKANLESDKSEKNTELAEHETTLAELEKKQTSVKPTLDSINKLLADFNFTGFKLELGGDEFTYKIIRLDGTPVEKTLSEGEKSFVTFLYFYNLLKGSQATTGLANNRIVVIDDPVSSLDNDILFVVSTLIRRLFENISNNTSNIKQLFIFTHNAYFFNEVTYNNGFLKNPEVRYILIKKYNNETKIKNCINEKPINSTYDNLWNEVRIAEKDKTSINIVSIQNTMRRIIEYYFQFLGGIDIKNLHTSKILKDKDDIAIYRSLLSWVNSGSHSSFDDLFYVDSDDSLLEKYLIVFKKIFEDSGNIAHYNMMMKIEGEQ
ncbi:AAA family ATPase [Treponema parvum]|uniref:AAA family ATPase n=1 Tax=Treponema parvum TaxID=138851 RepID=A0A975F0M9_9SPIR|nr:AAA family ATPase [Treponema parvum]QTQ12202.1 AAA family ATPase [Treponema parvum]